MNINRTSATICVFLGAVLLIASSICFGMSVTPEIVESSKCILLCVLAWFLGVSGLCCGNFVKLRRMHWVFAFFIMLFVSMGLFGVNQTSVSGALILLMEYESIVFLKYAGFNLLYTLPTILVLAYLYKYSKKNAKDHYQFASDHRLNGLQCAGNARKKARASAFGVIIACVACISFVVYIISIELSIMAYFEFVPHHADSPSEFFGFLNLFVVFAPSVVCIVLLIATYFTNRKGSWIQWLYMMIGTLCARAVIIRIYREIIIQLMEDSGSMFYLSQTVFFIPFIILCFCLFMLSIKRNEPNISLSAREEACVRE